MPKSVTAYVSPEIFSERQVSRTSIEQVRQELESELKSCMNDQGYPNVTVEVVTRNFGPFELIIDGHVPEEHIEQCLLKATHDYFERLFP